MKAHPYADAWPMLSEDELAELAEDIRANGLRDPIVTYGDLILDGRNRFAACEVAGIEPKFEGFGGGDDEALAFVQSVNNARRHQSKGSLAASWALSMLAAGKRAGGRWAQGSQNSANSRGEAEMYRVCGIIADHAPELLIDVRDDALTLNAAHEKACRRRDSEMELLAEQERIEAEEAAALASLPADFANQIGTTYSSARVAFAAWEDANRAEAARLRREREKEQQAKRDHDEAVKRQAKYLASWTSHYEFAANLREHPDRAEILAAMTGPDLRKYRDRFLAFEAANDWRTS